MDKNAELILKMIDFNAGNPDLIQHFLKVHQFAKLIGKMENISVDKMEILETAAIVHDIGIKICMEKFGECSGKLQEQEGPFYAEALLRTLGYKTEIIKRVIFLIAHHHTYSYIDDIDYQILIEADFLVNFYENNCNKESINETYNKIFKTNSGIMILNKIFFN